MHPLDMKYVQEVGLKLEKFSEQKTHYYNFRCPICGDSKKNPNKKRGFIFSTPNNCTQYRCYNCKTFTTFSKFLESQYPKIHERYVLERYKAGSTGKGTRCPNPKFKFNKPVFK